jgi:L-lactate dehydrogenase complex protein LldG
MVGLEMTSREARSLILGRIRDIAGERTQTAAEAHARIERTYNQAASLPREACLALFVERLKHYQVTVRRCMSGEVAAAVAATATARGKSRLVVPADLDARWLPPDITFVPDDRLSYRDLDVCDGVVTMCSLGIAATGTIALRHGAGEGRRALTLIPDYHLCVVLAGQVVETVPEAFRALAATRPALITTISGPSATADIEMTRVRGVHGPRTLDVVLAG